MVLSVTMSTNARPRLPAPLTPVAKTPLARLLVAARTGGRTLALTYSVPAELVPRHKERVPPTTATNTPCAPTQHWDSPAPAQAALRAMARRVCETAPRDTPGMPATTSTNVPKSSAMPTLRVQTPMAHSLALATLASVATGSLASRTVRPDSPASAATMWTSAQARAPVPSFRAAPTHLAPMSAVATLALWATGPNALMSTSAPRPTADVESLSRAETPSVASRALHWTTATRRDRAAAMATRFPSAVCVSPATSAQTALSSVSPRTRPRSPSPRHRVARSPCTTSRRSASPTALCLSP
mmetsp:Transcript_57615/g.86930  ORF Transcript_57615/g.86930 Transcript_57615/m.86930 type:complete len:300 (-) Transcript_57615:1922-2821(-)